MASLLFAIWDDDEQRLFFARDRIGVKPLFIMNIKMALLFASEIKTLLKNPIVEPKIDEQGLYEVFSAWSCKNIRLWCYKRHKRTIAR